MSTYDTIKHEGVEYLAGSGGSLVLSCPTCGRDRFRLAPFYFSRPDPQVETCFNHPDTPMVPVRVDEIESRWRAIWNKADGV